ncbi:MULTISPECIES: hypothetical protein [unclassified Streptomyces]|nr:MULTISPECIES: hypothetical protein [unclassified Streptomyces]
MTSPARLDPLCATAPDGVRVIGRPRGAGHHPVVLLWAGDQADATRVRAS